MREIRKVAVLGAGVMGSAIAAHIANAGVPCLLLDRVPDEAELRATGKGKGRNMLADAGLDATRRAKPPAFFIPEGAHLISTGNFDDHLDRVKVYDWIIEAVSEDIGIKRALLEKVQDHLAPGAAISSNTSGISLTAIAEGFGFRQHWLGTHFFNPPRYMKLLELIPTRDTLPDVVERIARFGDEVLGKGIVRAKDSPNFIANRIGTFFTMTVLSLMMEEGFSIEEIDLLTGPLIGLPKSATFRTLDLVGLDVLAHVLANLRESLPEETHVREPEFLSRMVERGLLGEKTGGGFYRRTGRRAGSGESEILVLDLATLQYRARQKPKFASLGLAQAIEDPRARARALAESGDRTGQFYRRLFSRAFHYAASCVPKISDDIVSVDRAMKWGFNWECGPFELWDAIGMEKVTSLWKEEKLAVPPLAAKLLSSGKDSFYRGAGEAQFFDLGSGDYLRVPEAPGVLRLAPLKACGQEVKKNSAASLIDVGDGVLCLEFHSKMNTIGPDIIEMVRAGLNLLDSGFDAMVIGNDAVNFCAGANLMLLLFAIEEGDWDEVHAAVRAFQQVNMALKYAPKPVVAAPFGLALGGGTEMPLHCARIVAAAETYMGLVETGVGLIPAGGGTKEMLLRAMDSVPADADPFPYLKQVFTDIGTAKVSTSAEDARKLGYLSARDIVCMNRDRQLATAKELARDLARLPHRPGKPREDITVSGKAGFSKMQLGLHLMRRADYISDYDVVVGTHLARVLSGGGEFTEAQQVSEQYLLDLEREAFISLCGQKQTAERIRHTLKTGKPLRN